MRERSLARSIGSVLDSAVADEKQKFLSMCLLNEFCVCDLILTPCSTPFPPMFAFFGEISVGMDSKFRLLLIPGALVGKGEKGGG